MEAAATTINWLESLMNKWLADKPDHFLVDIKVLPGNKVEVFVDADKGIQIDTCAQISRYLEQYLDEELPLGEKYTLEVSSPGMSSPIKVLRQYQRRIGNELAVLKADGVKVIGILKQVDESGIVLEESIMKKKKVVETKTWEIPFSDIKTSKLNFKF